MPETPRTAVRLGLEDEELLDRLRQHHGHATVSSLLRFLIRAEARRLGYLSGPPPADPRPGPARRTPG